MLDFAAGQPVIRKLDSDSTERDGGLKELHELKASLGKGLHRGLSLKRVL